MMHTRVRFTCFAAVVAATALPAIVSAQIFSGVDAQTGVVAPGSAPNSLAARNSMLAALGATPFTLNTFEGLPLGNTTTNLGGGVTATYTNLGFGTYGIATGNHPLNGFNTTSGGSQYLAQSTEPSPGSITLNFATAINFFGGYFSAVETGCGATTATWGAASFVLANSGAANCFGTGGLQWFGFVAPAAASFTSVTFTQVSGTSFRDNWGMDDIIYGSRTATALTPEPSTYALMGLGLLAIGAAARRRRTSI